VSKGDVEKVCKYIMNQKEHHQSADYEQEHEQFLKFYQQTIQIQKKIGFLMRRKYTFQKAICQWLNCFF
jgi:hypothetical protein